MKKLFLVALIATLSISCFAQKIEDVTSPRGITEQIIQHKGFTVSYNDNLLIPNWVTWELTADEANAKVASRTDEFFPDPDVKGYTALTTDYSNSGYARGHMAPAADMKWSRVAMEESFYLSNICPQLPSINDGPWLELEQKCRYWAKKYGSIYITCGPLFLSATEKNIGKNQVAVPDAFFKVILQKRDNTWTAAGFVVLNIPYGANVSINELACSVRAIEMKTGYQFFTGLPKDIAEQVKTQFNINDWYIPNWTKN